MKNLLKLGLGLIFVLINTIVLVSGAGGGVGNQNSASADDTGVENADTPNTKMLHIGFPLVLECKFSKEEGEKYNIQWYKDNVEIDSDDEHYKNIQENSTLIVPKADMEEVGVYKCKKNLEILLEINVIYLYYKKLPKSVTVLKGDILSLTCDVEGNPLPTVSWFQDEEPVEKVINETRYSLAMNDNNITNAVFNIKSADYIDRASYKCHIESQSIHYNTTTFVRVKDMYAALWPFLGICVEVFILCLIILIYEKKRAKADFEESDTDQPSSDTKSKSDQNKDSVRHRK